MWVLTKGKGRGDIYQLPTAAQQTTPELSDFKQHLISHKWLGRLESSGDLGWSPLTKAGLEFVSVVSWRDRLRAASLKCPCSHECWWLG